MPRDVGPWTQHKLKILEDYLPIYLQITTRAIETVYIDGFAGPGTNQLPSGDVIDGSPIIAMNARAKNGHVFDRLIFIESDGKVAEELEDAIQKAEKPSRAEVIVGDVNDALPRAVARFNRRSPTFVFLDTVGIEPRWSTIERIAPWQTELLINFPFGMSINRNPNSPKVTAYFGTEEWRKLWWSESTGRVRAMLDLYKGKMKGLGYVYTTEFDRLIRASRNQQLYYLVFASKREPAKRVMDWVYRQKDASGQAFLDL